MSVNDQDEEYERRRNKVSERVKLLLAKAAGTDSDAERETFEAAAATMMQRWMIDEAALRSEMGAGFRGAGDILEEVIRVAWEDGLGIERGQLVGAVGRAFGAECVIGCANNPWARWLTDDTSSAYVNVYVSVFGTRAALDAVRDLVPLLLVQCDGDGEKAWQEKLSARRRVHEERRLRPPEYGGLLGTLNDPYGTGRVRSYAGYGMNEIMDLIARGSVSMDVARDLLGMGTEAKIGEGYCDCGCGEPVDIPVRPDPFTYTGSSQVGGIFAGGPGPYPAQSQGAKTAAQRLAEERQRFLKSFIFGWAARAEQRLKAAHSPAAQESPEEAADAERYALVLKADAERAREVLAERYPNVQDGGTYATDMDGYRAGGSAASGADLGGQRFGGGYGGRRELGT